MEGELALAQRAATVALHLSAALLAGALAAGAWLRHAASAWAGGLAPRLRRLALGAALTAALAHVAVLWLEAAYMAEVPLPEAWPAVQSVLGATHYGAAWAVGAGALSLCAFFAAAPRGLWPGRAALPGSAALMVFLYSRSSVSHAGAGGDFTLAVVLDWVHLVLVSLWVGEVLVAGLLVLRPGPGPDAPARLDCAGYVAALSRSATFALAVIFVTGAFAAWRSLGTSLDSSGDPFATPYAAALLVKIVLVLCAAALGGLNRFVVMPGLLAGLRAGAAVDAGRGRNFVRILRIEAVFLVAALVAAAFLGATPPPGAG